MLDYKNNKSDRQWRATTGLSSVKFHALCKAFSACFEKINEQSLSEIETNLKGNFLLKTYEDCLFFILFQMKNALTYDSLGFLINTDSVNAQRNYERYLNILELTLTELGAMPKRDFKDIAEFEAYLEGEEEVILDVTEHATQRPHGKEAQKAVYSGKKNSIRTKSLYLAIRNAEFYT